MRALHPGGGVRGRTSRAHHPPAVPPKPVLWHGVWVCVQEGRANAPGAVSSTRAQPPKQMSRRLALSRRLLCDGGELLDGSEQPLLPTTMDPDSEGGLFGVQPEPRKARASAETLSAETMVKTEEEAKPEVKTEVKAEAGPSGGAPAAEVSEELLKATITTIISEGSLEELSNKKVRSGLVPME